MAGINETTLTKVYEALAGGMSLSIKSDPKSRLNNVAALLTATAKAAEDWDGTAPARMRDEATRTSGAAKAHASALVAVYQLIDDARCAAVTTASQQRAAVGQIVEPAAAWETIAAGLSAWAYGQYFNNYLALQTHVAAVREARALQGLQAVEAKLRDCLSDLESKCAPLIADAQARSDHAAQTAGMLGLDGPPSKWKPKSGSGGTFGGGKGGRGGHGSGRRRLIGRYVPPGGSEPWDRFPKPGESDPSPDPRPDIRPKPEPDHIDPPPVPEDEDVPWTQDDDVPWPPDDPYVPWTPDQPDWTDGPGDAGWTDQPGRSGYPEWADGWTGSHLGGGDRIDGTTTGSDALSRLGSPGAGGLSGGANSGLMAGGIIGGVGAIGAIARLGGPGGPTGLGVGGSGGLGTGTGGSGGAAGATTNGSGTGGAGSGGRGGMMAGGMGGAGGGSQSKRRQGRAYRAPRIEANTTDQRGVDQSGRAAGSRDTLPPTRIIDLIEDDDW